MSFLLLCAMVLPKLAVATQLDESEAGELRYALVIGSNRASDARLAPLLFAESDAFEMVTALTNCCGFVPDDPSRTQLLLAPSRASVIDAARMLGARVATDRSRFGSSVRTSFLFYFAGHGETGRLFLPSESLTRRDLRRILELVGADLNVGIFDACRSGGLAPTDDLRRRGIEVEPANPLATVPTEIRTAKGTTWIAASQADEFAHESEDIRGAVFTRFFIAALTSVGEPTKGMSLLEVFEAASRRTSAYVRSRGLRQTPQLIPNPRFDDELLPFTYSDRARATLLVSPTVPGPVLLKYLDQQLPARVITRTGGEPAELSVFAGDAELLVPRADASLLRYPVAFANGGFIALHTELDPPRVPMPGEAFVMLASRSADDITMNAETREDAVSLRVSAGYSMLQTPESLVWLEHAGVIGLHLDWNQLLLSVGVSGGTRRVRRGALELDLSGVGFVATAGVGWNIGRVRLGPVVRFGVDWIASHYASGYEEQLVTLSVLGGAAASIRLYGDLFAHLETGIGGLRAHQDTYADPSFYWALAYQLGVHVNYRFF